jgi:U2 small nuclear ribonucleoprotein A'
LVSIRPLPQQSDLQVASWEVITFWRDFSEVYAVMKRLTVDVILKSPAFRNTLKERELDLRGNKIPRIENLGATQDQFDTIDFSNNQIETLEDFPILRRCTTLLFHNNLVRQIAPNFADCLPNLHTLMLTNNDIRTFQQLIPLQKCKFLARLSLYLNPVTNLPNYRLTVIQLLPTVGYLDWQKVTQQERNDGRAVFDTGS